MEKNSVPFAFLTVEQRASLSPEDFGDPERKLFPVLTQQDIDLAPKRISFFPDYEELKERLISIALRKGFSLPEAWVADSTSAAHNFSDENTENVENPDSFTVFSEDGETAEFELDPSTKKEDKSGDWVYRTGKIFQAGSYKDKKFELSPEEMCEAIADFKPVELDLEHIPTVLDGELGTLEAVALGADGWSLIGSVRMPKWLDEQSYKTIN